MGKTKGKRRASRKQTKEPALQHGFKEALVAEMRSLGYVLCPVNFKVFDVGFC